MRAAEPRCKTKGRGTNSWRSKDSLPAQIHVAPSCCSAALRRFKDTDPQRATGRGALQLPGAARLCCSPPGGVVGTGAAARQKWSAGGDLAITGEQQGGSGVVAFPWQCSHGGVPPVLFPRWHSHTAPCWAPCRLRHRSGSSRGDAGEHEVTSSLLVLIIRVTSSGGKVDGRSRG